MSCGLDHFLQNPPERFRHRPLGLLGHAASVTADLTHAAEAVAGHPDLDLVRLFGPEHGFFGKALHGEKVEDGRHPALDLPVFSLYGEHRTPPDEWLEGLSALLIDFQDLGVRCYTYASTLENVLGVCARIGLPVVVLDRLPPLHRVVDGPGLDPELRSFVGQIDLPFVYGKSTGELAVWLKEAHGWELDLTVIEDEGKARTWVPPSPAIPSVAAAQLYPVTVWCEAVPDVTVDRGGDRSFQVWGMQGLDPEQLAVQVAGNGLIAVPTTAMLEGRSVPAVSLTVTGKFFPAQAAVRLLGGVAQQFGVDRLFDEPGARPEFFDQLWGSRSVRQALQAR